MCFIKKKQKTTNKQKPKKTRKQGRKKDGSPQTVGCVVAKAINGEKQEQGMFSFSFLSLVWGVVGKV